MVRQISWSGYAWNVRTTSSGSTPGPNNWSDSTNNAWIDNQGNLHLKITNISGKWYCTEVYTSQTFGPGIFITGMITNPSDPVYDSYTVAGPFYYLNDNNELDIEFSRWNNPNLTVPVGTYTIQPGLSAHSYFDINATNTNNKIVWSSDGKVYFETKNSSGNIIGSWQYTGGHKTASGGTFRLMIWLFEGNPPSDGLEKELVLSSFSYTPGSTLSASLTINPNAIKLGQTAIFTANATGGILPCTYSWNGLPSGCTGSNKNKITCVPRRTGIFNIAITVTDNTGAESAAYGSLTVRRY
jgi:hypothetical protein